MHICVVVGTRPEIIKMASVIHELVSRSINFTLIHTGQHYDDALSAVFFRELELPIPHVDLEVGSGSHAQQTGTAMVRLEKFFRNSKPDIVLVQGDTNTTLASALAAAKLGINVGHVEAGLRSYDLRMPEEHNRRLTDHLSSHLFAPTQRSAQVLRNESCWGEIYTTGNTIIDACLRYAPKALKNSSISDQIPYERFALATTHRAENIDNPKTLRQLFDIVTGCPIPVVYPVHPRTLDRLLSAGLYTQLKESKNVFLLPSLGYFDFLAILMRCHFIITDSGGIQEEATAPNLRKKVFVLRESTERPEAAEAGYVDVVGTEPLSVLANLQQFANTNWKCDSASPFGDGRAAVRIVDILEESGVKHAQTVPVLQ